MSVKSMMNYARYAVAPGAACLASFFGPAPTACRGTLDRVEVGRIHIVAAVAVALGFLAGLGLLPGILAYVVEIDRRLAHDAGINPEIIKYIESRINE